MIFYDVETSNYNSQRSSYNQLNPIAIISAKIEIFNHKLSIFYFRTNLLILKIQNEIICYEKK